MIVALLFCVSVVVIFNAKRTHFLSALTNLIARLIATQIDNPMLIPFWVNPGAAFIGRLCVVLIVIFFGLLASSFVILV